MKFEEKTQERPVREARAFIDEEGDLILLDLSNQDHVCVSRCGIVIPYSRENVDNSTRAQEFFEGDQLLITF